MVNSLGDSVGNNSTGNAVAADAASSTGYEGDGSEVSTISRETRAGNRRRWFVMAF